MKLSVILFLTFLPEVLFSQTTEQITDPADLVNPLMGTQSNFSLSAGNTYPAIALPWGMNFWVRISEELDSFLSLPVLQFSFPTR